MLEKIAIFILFLGPLVFFHELGHFLFARLFGVRVEVFSIGFGPKILKFKKGFTEYAISLIPLGGYVKMFGDDPLNSKDVPENLRRYSFVFKSKMARFWIVFGGPLANFILAFFIFFTLFVTGEKVPEIKMGNIEISSEFYKLGLRSGDVLKKVNENVISSPSDILLESDGKIRTLEVSRLGTPVIVNLDLTADEFFEKMAEYPPLLIKPVLKSAAGEYYGLSTDQSSIDWSTSLEELELSSGKIYLHKLSTQSVLENEPELDVSVPAVEFNHSGVSIHESVVNQNLFPVDLVVKSVNMNSPADKAGLKSGDIIKRVRGVTVLSFESLRKLVQDSDSSGVEVEVIRDGETLKKTIVPEVKTISGATVKLIGVYSSGMYVGGKYVNTEPLSFGHAVKKSFSRTIESIKKTLEGFKKLIFAETSFKNIGGPLAIGKVASDSFNTSMSYFFQLMALISVNLGVINLFPIPVLDGGHIMFIILEVVNGGPLSRRKLEIAQQFGLSLLLLLMVGALFNDFIRFL
ncbi:RIP metalloprotease RseP [Bacteriovorax sp. Seq25_V]|uniref:RIP metalloprotease RseP n=1 Tax=Bacteriovorax sp. Seq25_V TaxID=1201288 RepID=UPI00038A29DF|nr:RIP metalloprotease RseP [Bacteriovorax sp. Seq25_V]EQC44801.1 RIP metalloprotease RseP-like protein [Bacteriovorax sp. Seq25_V]